MIRELQWRDVTRPVISIIPGGTLTRPRNVSRAAIELVITTSARPVLQGVGSPPAHR